MTPQIWTPEDEFRRWYPALGARLDRLPFAEIAQHALDIEKELQSGERVCLEVENGAMRSEGELTIGFRTGAEISYMLTKPFGGLGDWRPTGWRPA